MLSQLTLSEDITSFSTPSSKSVLLQRDDSWGGVFPSSDTLSQMGIYAPSSAHCFPHMQVCSSLDLFIIPTWLLLKLLRRSHPRKRSSLGKRRCICIWKILLDAQRTSPYNHVGSLLITRVKEVKKSVANFGAKLSSHKRRLARGPRFH